MRYDTLILERVLEQKMPCKRLISDEILCVEMLSQKRLFSGVLYWVCYYSSRHHAIMRSRHGERMPSLAGILLELYF